MAVQKCGREGCDPSEQVRGRMGAGDYADVLKSNAVPVPGAVPADDLQRYHELVELDDANRDDVRICCLQCGKATGWQKPDAPGMPGIGVEFTRKTWANLMGAG